MAIIWNKATCLTFITGVTDVGIREQQCHYSRVVSYHWTPPGELPVFLILWLVTLMLLISAGLKFANVYHTMKARDVKNVFMKQQQ